MLCQLVAYLVFVACVLSALREPSCAGCGATNTLNGGVNSERLALSPLPGASNGALSDASIRRGPDKLHLLHLWERKGEARSACESPARRRDESALAFVREFFVARGEANAAATTVKFNRTAELMRANRITVSNNPCGVFAYVVEDEDHVWPLRRLHDEIGVSMRIYWSPGGTSFDRIFLAARMSSSGSGGLFLVSTADVALPPIQGHLERACERGLQRTDLPVLFVASRRDIFLDDADNCQIYNGDRSRCMFPRIKTCQLYKDKYWSWDLFLGRTSLITDSVLEKTWYSPSYWGAENVATKVLVGNAAHVYNLCPYVDVVHFHNVPRKGNSRARIFIRGIQGKAANAITRTEGNVSSVCDVKELLKLERLLKEYTW